MTTKKYKVRSLPLHKVIEDNGVKTTQGFKPGSTVELTEEEAKSYQHLVEPLANKGASK